MSRLSFEAFEDNFGAYFAYVQSLSASEAADELEARLADGSWQRAHDPWLHTLERLYYLHGAEAARLDKPRVALIQQLLSTEIGQLAHAMLPSAIRLGRNVATEREAHQVVAWLLEHAGPGDAGLVLDVFVTLHDGHPEKGLQYAQPLARWALQKGSAELRAQHRGWLFVRLLDSIAFNGGDADEIRLAIRIGLRNPGWSTYIINSHDGDWTRLLTLIEHALEGRSFELVQNVLESAGLDADRVLTAALSTPQYPRIRTGVLQAICNGALPRDFAPRAWGLAFTVPCPGDEALRIASPTVLDRAMHALWTRIFPTQQRASEPTLLAWAEFLIGETFRIYLSSQDPHGYRVLEKWIGFDLPLVEPVRTRLLAWVAALPEDAATKLARQLLDVSDPTHSQSSSARVLSALRVLSSKRRVQSARPEQEYLLGALVRQMLVVLGRAWPDPVAGVDVERMLRGARNAELVEQADKVATDGARLLIDRAGLIEAMNVEMNEQERLAVGALYVIHELVHHAQALGPKHLIGELRSTGFAGETNLMHVDLGADHVAAHIASAAFPAWSLLWLKDLQGRSLAAFPTTRSHSSSGRARKNTRLVGLRADWLVRKHFDKLVERLRGGYAFCDAGRGGGPFLLLSSGPPFALIGSTTIAMNDAGQLFPENGSPALEVIDELLLQLIASCNAP